ncbi:MAG TPA: PHB depolymerase family esterase [Polyangia bacterium]|jgi:polyhydroxybutyrate depolymerase|nr:PHB depolymerase family esterase [Polyangia bacterium]
MRAARSIQLFAVGLLVGCGTTHRNGGAISGCGSGFLQPGDQTVMLPFGGVARDYILHVPTGYDGNSPVPLVLDIHGLTSNAFEQELLSGWRQKADASGFIVVYPDGLNASWNGGSLCCGTSQMNGVDDEGFLRTVVAKVSQDGCIDPKRVYATGLSNGGAMSHLLACRAADLFAATAPVSMGNGTMPCQPSRPLSVIMFRGTSDLLVPYAGGTFPGAQADFDQWTELDHCTGAPETTQGICSTNKQCAGGAEVSLCTINAGHVLYAQAAAQGAPVPDVVWEAFQSHTLP